MKNIIALTFVFAGPLNAVSSVHDYVKCTAIKNDHSGHRKSYAYTKVGNKYCELSLNVNGNPYERWPRVNTACVSASHNSDGNFTLLFKKWMGSGAYLYYHYNLNKNLEGYIRLLSREPKDINKPINPNADAVIQVSCSKESMNFKY